MGDGDAMIRYLIAAVVVAGLIAGAVAWWDSKMQESYDAGYAARQNEIQAAHDEKMKELETENARLKKMYAEERIKAELRQEALEGKL